MVLPMGVTKGGCHVAKEGMHNAQVKLVPAEFPSRFHSVDISESITGQLAELYGGEYRGVGYDRQAGDHLDFPARR